MKAVTTTGAQFLVMAVVGLVHYGITGMEDAIYSALVALHAGYGILVYWAYCAYVARVSPRGES